MYQIIKVDSKENRIENLGTKEKFWITHDNYSYLFKIGRPNTGENWAEKVACELCRLLEIPHAEYDFACCDGRLGTISRNVVPKNSRLISGNELLPKMSGDYDGAKIYNQRGHTISRVFTVLRRFTSDSEESLRLFLGYLMLDAWIGNSDRHHENWALINHEGVRVSLAPTFDHASSLGRELSDDKRLILMSGRDPRSTIELYSQKARSALYHNKGGVKAISPLEAFRYASYKLKGHSDDWLCRLKAVKTEDIDKLIGMVPCDLMSEPSRDFVKKILCLNRRRILEG